MQFLKRLVELFLKPFHRSHAEGQKGKEQNVENLLKSIDLFAHLEAKQLRKLARLFLPRNYAKGDLIIKKGDTGLGMFLIVSGQSEVFDEQGSVIIPLATLQAGSFVGEMSLIDERPRSANVKALEDAKCLLLTRDSFNGLVKREPEILWGIVPVLVERLRQSDRRLAELAEYGTPAGAAEPDASSKPLETRAPSETEMQRLPSSKETRIAKQDVNETDDREEVKREEEKETEEVTNDQTETEKNGLASSFLQLSTSSFMFFTSTFFLGTQEFFRLLAGKGSISQKFSQSETVVSSLTTSVEGNMNEKSRKVFNSLQEFLSSLLSLFER